MKLPSNIKYPSPFFGNYFCLIPNTKLAFIAISKNAVTFLKRVALYNQSGEWINSLNKTHDTVGYEEDSPYLIPVNKMKAYEKKNGELIKFVVWRDPIDRITSTYKLFCLEREFRKYFYFLELFDNPSFDRFMLFLKFEWGKSNPLFQDEHIRRQVDYFSPKDVNYIVPINKIYTFLNEHNVPFIEDIANKTNTSFVIKNDEYIKAIQQYYKKDYAIKCNY